MLWKIDKILSFTTENRLGYFSTEEEFFRGRSNPKNRELMRIFKDLGYVEEMGSGIHRILEKYSRSIFEFSQNYITVTFPFASESKGEILNILKTTPK